MDDERPPDVPGAPSEKGSSRAGDQLGSRSNPRNNQKARPDQDSPWADAPALASQPVLLDHRAYLIDGKVDVVLRIRRKQDQSPEFLAFVRENAFLRQCTCCDRRYAEGSGVLATAVCSDDNPTAVAVTWFCARCGEMDDNTLLAICRESFLDEVEHSREREAMR